MRRVTTQLVIATLITVAFVLTALSGLVLFMPGRLLPALGISLLMWRTIHEWSALVLTAAVVAHLVLQRRRAVEMVARLVRPVGPGRTTSPLPSRSQVAAERVAPASADQPRPRFNRRWFLVLAAGAVAAVIATLGLDHAGSRSAFPVLNVESEPPPVTAASWVVVIDGLVDSPQRFERTAWLALPHTQETRDFHCVEGWSVSNLGWKGVRVADLLSLAKPQPEGEFVTFHAYGGTYSDSLALNEAKAPETLLADSLDGGPLPAAHGGPLRLVIPSQLGYKNVKWVVRLEVTAARAEGYWEAQGGYPVEAPVGGVPRQRRVRP